MKEQPRNIVHLLIYLAVFAVVTALFGPVSRGPLTLHVPDLMGTGLYLRLDWMGLSLKASGSIRGPKPCWP